MNFSLYDWRTRLKVSCIHFLISVSFISTLAFFVFWFWYPHPFNVLPGGREIFLLMMACDVVLGPLIMFIVFSKKKSKSELKLDIIFIIIFQLLALSYGMWSVFVSRPVYIVFERDSYRVVRSVDIPLQNLSKRPIEYSSFPVTGPTLLSLRDFSNTQEQMNTTFLELEGLPMSAQPEFWQEYSKSKNRILKSGKSIDKLIYNFPEYKEKIQSVIEKSKSLKNDLLYFPFVDRGNYWTVLVDRNSLELIAYLPIDSYR